MEETNAELKIDLDKEKFQTYEDLAKICNKNWHRKCFANTKVEHSDILQSKAITSRRPYFMVPSVALK